MKKIMFSILALYLAACSSGGGGSSGGTASTSPNLDNPPSSAIPTTPANDSATSGGQGGGACGLNGQYGICYNLTLGGGETQSIKIYTVIANCNAVASKFTFYTGASCGGSKYYERTRSYNMSVVGDSSISGAKEVNLTLSSITQEFFAAAASGTHQAEYMFCDSDDSTYTTTPQQTKTGSGCYTSHTTSLNDYNVVKVTAGGMFLGNTTSCTGANGECISTGERPTTLDTGSGVPVWQ